MRSGQRPTNTATRVRPSQSELMFVEEGMVLNDGSAASGADQNAGWPSVARTSTGDRCRQHAGRVARHPGGLSDVLTAVGRLDRGKHLGLAGLREEATGCRERAFGREPTAIAPSYLPTDVGRAYNFCRPPSLSIGSQAYWNAGLGLARPEFSRDYGATGHTSSSQREDGRLLASRGPGNLALV